MNAASHRQRSKFGGDVAAKKWFPQKPVSRAAAATMLAVRAEFAGWELARVLGFPDGSRRVWLRRRRSPGLLPDLTP